MRKKIMLCLGIVMAAGAPVWAEGEGDAFRGKMYADQLCKSCHSLTADQAASPNPGAPPFRTITLADSSGETFSTWLNTKHPNIPPGTLVKPSQAEDIATYIASLKSAPAN